MLPVIADLVAIQQTDMTGCYNIVMNDFDTIGILMNGYHLVGQMTRYGITIALQCDQTRAGYARQYFNIAIERRWHRHQVQLFLLQRIGDGDARIIRMLDF